MICLQCDGCGRENLGDGDTAVCPSCAGYGEVVTSGCSRCEYRRDLEAQLRSARESGNTLAVERIGRLIDNA